MCLLRKVPQTRATCCPAHAGPYTRAFGHLAANATGIISRPRGTAATNPQQILQRNILPHRPPPRQLEWRAAFHPPPPFPATQSPYFTTPLTQHKCPLPFAHSSRLFSPVQSLGTTFRPIACQSQGEFYSTVAQNHLTARCPPAKFPGMSSRSTCPGKTAIKIYQLIVKFVIAISYDNSMSLKSAVKIFLPFGLKVASLDMPTTPTHGRRCGGVFRPTRGLAWEQTGKGTPTDLGRSSGPTDAPYLNRFGARSGE